MGNQHYCNYCKGKKDALKNESYRGLNFTDQQNRWTLMICCLFHSRTWNYKHHVYFETVAGEIFSKREEFAKKIDRVSADVVWWNTVKV